MKKITFLAALFAAFTMNAQIFTEDFELDVDGATTFANWDSLDEDGDGEFFEVFNADGTGYPWLMVGLGADSDSWEGGTPFTPDNWLITKDPVDLSEYSGAELSFNVGTYQTGGTFLDDRYAVFLSTSNDPAVIATETPLYTAFVGDDVTAAAGDGSDSAANVVLDASAADGMMVYIAFRHWDTFDQNSVLLDNIELDGTLSVQENAIASLSHAVTANELQLRAGFPIQSVQLYNVLGQEVINTQPDTRTANIEISALNQGVYIARVSVEGQTKSFKIVKR